MKRWAYSVVALACVVRAVDASPSSSVSIITDFVEQYCVDCHDDSSAKGDFDITSLGFTLDDAGNRARWTRVYDLVQQCEMPPPEKSAVSTGDRAEFIAKLSAELLAAARANIAKNGRAPVRRLTRVEFENNLRALLKLPDLDIRDKVPEERDAHGFTKVAALLDMSRVHLEGYMDAAETALRAAIAPSSTPPQTPRPRRFTGTDLFSALDTFGEREAMFFARDNRMVPITGQQLQEMTPEQRRDHTLELSLFRSATWPYFGYPRGFVATSAGRYRVRFMGRAVRQVRDFRLVPAHDPITLTFRARQPSGADVSGDVRETGGWLDLVPEAREYETTILLKAGETFEYSPLGLPVPFIRTDGGFFYDYPPMPPEGHRGIAIQWLEISGPIASAEWPPSSHRVLFDDVNPAQGTSAEAARLFRRFAAMAALRPMNEKALEPFLRLIGAKLAAGATFTEALLAGYQALLCSSHCLYLTEPGFGASDDHFAIAARLSHFLWNTRPDAELTALANGGRLRDPAVLRAQTDRLLRDPREQFVRTFADEWLDLRKLRRDIPDERLYPEYRRDDYLVDSMERETHAFLSAMIRDNLPVTTLIATDFTFVNDRLARHYDLPRVSGSAMQRIVLPPWSPYGGIITQAALMKHTANGTTTSPVLRGVWIMEKLLGEPPPPPPKSVPAIEPDIRGAQTIRELLAKHTESKTCAACHARFDPIGFAMENFDVMGVWRDRYRGLEKGEKITGIDPAGHPYTYYVGHAVDAAGKLRTGETFQDIRELKRLLVANPRGLARNFLHHLALHATGAPVGFADRQEIEAMLDACAEGGYRIGDLLHALVQSRIFLGNPS